MSDQSRSSTFQQLVEVVGEVAIYMLDPEGRVMSWSPAAERIKGWRREEVEGQSFGRFFVRDDQRAGAPEAILARAREEGRVENEGWRLRKDGSRFWANASVLAIRGDDGEVVGFATVTRDITGRRNAQLELQKAHERLAQSQKMEAMGQLTGGVAHDFNNLLMVVAGQAQLLRRRIGDNPQALRALEAIEVSARRGQDLTRQLLAFARRQRLNPVPLSLHERAAAFREQMATSLGPAIELRVEAPDTIWPIQVDPGELELALLNLAVNARDAMPAGGRLTISTRNVTLEEAVEPHLMGDFVALTVRDSGVGIPPDILPRIFEPFFTTKEMARCAGLGLSQVYGFAEQSGGRVRAESVLGQGSAFTLYLPRSCKAACALDAAVGEIATRNARVLVVEDNPDVAEVAAGLLEQLGNRPQVVANAEAALRVLREGDRPDVVFSDIIMAGDMDGLALARRVRAEWPDLPILLTTGYSQSAANAGQEFAILPKPYQLPELARALGTVLEGGGAEA